MYPSMPQPPVQAMQGQSPAQQFGYANAPVQQGVGSLVPQMPMYGAYPTYMAQGGMMPTMDQMAPQMPMGQAATQFMAGGGPVGTMTADLARQMNSGTPEQRMAALRQARGDGARSGKGQMTAPNGQQVSPQASFLMNFFSRLGGGRDKDRGLSPLFQRGTRHLAPNSGKGQQQGQPGPQQSQR